MWFEALSKFKKESGKTLKQISEESKVPLGTLNKIFAGQTRDPKLDTLKAIVHCLGHTLDDLEPAKIEPLATSEDEEGELSVDEVVAAFVSAGIVKPGQDLSDADLRFLMVIIDSIEAWFARHDS